MNRPMNRAMNRVMAQMSQERKHTDMLLAYLLQLVRLCAILVQIRVLPVGHGQGPD